MPMFAPAHPEVLAHDWLPPSLIGRARELEQLRGWLGDPVPERPLPWAVLVRGPPGSGTSATSRLAARRLLEAYRRERPEATPPVVLPIRVRWCAGTHGVATALLQRLDEGFRGQGFPVVEIVAGLLRRLARRGQPAVVILDDVGPDTPDLTPILRGLLNPLRFLPEGVDAVPAIWTIVAGSVDRDATLRAWRAVGFPADAVTTLPPVDRELLRAILFDRTARALGREPPEAWIDRWSTRADATALGASRALDLVRRELLGPASVRLGTVFAPRGAPPVLSVEARVVEALARSGDGHGQMISVAELRDREQQLARAEGVRPLPATTLWRRLVHLEAAGLVRREVRPGGPGGTRSRLELLRPVSEWPVARSWSHTHRAVAVPDGRGVGAAGPRWEPARVPLPVSVPGTGAAASRPSRPAPGS